MAKSIILPPGIASYANLIEPRADPQGKMKYSVSLLISKSRAKELEPLRALALEIATLKWGAKAKAILENAKYPLIKDGDKKVDDEGKVDPIYKGMLVISSKTDRKPGVVDAARQPVFTDEDVYSGCLIRISGAIFAYDYQGNKGVSFGLNNVQVLKKLARLDGRKAAEEEFTEWQGDGETPAAGGVDPLA
jgi:hypothetical protein